MEVHQDSISMVLPTLGFQQGIVSVRGRMPWAPQLAPKDAFVSSLSAPALPPQLLGTGRSMNAFSDAPQGQGVPPHHIPEDWASGPNFNTRILCKSKQGPLATLLPFPHK